jgi:hypothetical protein
MVLAVVTLGAGPVRSVGVAGWDAYRAGPLDLSGPWRPYPPNVTAGSFKHAPVITVDGGRPVLQLATEADAVRIGREAKIDVTQTPWLVWEWKPLVLPDGGDVRNRKRNDQAGRIMLVFAGMKALLYVWDTTAPVGAEARSDPFDFFQRVLIVVRSGSQGVGEWSRERRDVYADFKRVYEEEPPALKWVGVESYSDDTKTRSAVRFGPVHFEAR